MSSQNSRPPKPPLRVPSPFPKALQGERSQLETLPEFEADEEPTRPEGIHARAARLVSAWRALTPEDQRWLERLLELMAWGPRK